MLKNINEINEFFGLFGCFISFFFICFFMLFFGFFLGEKSNYKNKNIPFESGVVSVGNSNLRLSIKFYLLAVFFVIFDSETPYLYSWVLNICSNGIFGFLTFFWFILFILLSLFYLIRMNMLNF
ncbi:NADH-quinone oxidoreductase subunit A [Buchnera aphidicola]|uniref:NADH-quinone oxidoreductase subunit A n=1 Tax=Buchnera aphidicola TaxID=9 RepID=UPI0031B8B076